MRYPDNFNTSAFPAGPRIALSRVMGIGVMIVFVLIMIVGGLIVWASRSQMIHPFLVSIDNFTGAWQVVGHDHGERTISRNRAMQESVIAKFTKNWFSVSANLSENDDMWYGFSEKSECNADNVPDRAQIYCNASEDLYNKFINNIVPDYRMLAENGTTWSVDIDDIYVSATGDVTDTGGTWRVITNIKSNIGDNIPVISYVTLGTDYENYPQNMGFYITDFNAYKTVNNI